MVIKGINYLFKFKNFVFIILGLLFVSPVLFSQQENLYGEGNGKIIGTRTINNVHYTIRKHETNNVIIGRSPIMYVYDDFDQIKQKKISDLYENANVSTLEIAVSINNPPWVKIVFNNKVGWIECLFPGDPYADNNWSIIEKIYINNSIIIVRKLQQVLEATSRVNVRDIPSTTGKVLFVMDKWVPVNTIAITENKENIDGITSHWIKIVDNKGRMGWIFGGYTGVERGGALHLTPEYIINDDLSRP